MALLYDSTLEFPGEWSTQQLPNSGKKNKRPSAWAEFHEEKERPSSTERWAPRQPGLGDMVISRTLKVNSAFSLSLQCLTSLSFTGIGDNNADNDDDDEEEEADAAAAKLRRAEELLLNTAVARPHSHCPRSASEPSP